MAAIRSIVLRAQDPHFKRKCRKGLKLLVKLVVAVGVSYLLSAIIRQYLVFIYDLDLDEESPSRLIKLIAMLIDRTLDAGLFLLMFKRDLRVLLKWLGQPASWLKSLLLPLIVALVSKFLWLIVPATIRYCLSFYSIDSAAVGSYGGEHGGFLLQLLSGLFGLIVAPTLEEILFRGIVFVVFLRLFGKWSAILISVLAFGLMHPLSFSSWVHALDPCIGAACAFFVLFKTRRLSSCILLHGLDNAILGVLWIIIGLPLSHGIWMV